MWLQFNIYYLLWLKQLTLNIVEHEAMEDLQTDSRSLLQKLSQMLTLIATQLKARHPRLKSHGLMKDKRISSGLKEKLILKTSIRKSSISSNPNNERAAKFRKINHQMRRDS